MAQTTEAACLLQSGSMYSRRLGLRTGSGGALFFGVKPGGFSLYFGDAPIYHFDLDGRWQRAFVEGVHYLKGLDGTVQAIDRDREGPGMVLRRRTLPPSEAAGLDASIRAVALALIGDLDSGRSELIPPPPTARPVAPEELREYLRRVKTKDAAAWSSLARQYRAIYRPWPFLPPDAPKDVVLQATVGNAGASAFGGLDAGEPRARSAAEFEEHAEAVAALLGLRVEQSRGVFLAGPDVLRRPVEEVLGYLGTVDDVFPSSEQDTPRLGAVHALLDDFRPPLPDREGWGRLRAARLGRVTLGVESGSPEVRAAFGKSWDDGSIRGTVADLKRAGIGLGLVVLAGAGGRPGARAHSEATVALLGSLGLGKPDLVSIVDARSLGLPAFGADPLSDEETARQSAELKARLSPGRPSIGPRVVAYNPDKQGL